MTLSSSHGHACGEDYAIAGRMGHNRCSNTIDGRTHSAVIVPSKVPPPRGFVLTHATRDKNGFFINSKKKTVDQDSHTSSELSSAEAEDEKSAAKKGKLFAPKDDSGSLKRSIVIKKLSPMLEGKVKDGKAAEGCGAGTKDPTESCSQTEKNYFIKKNDMKRSLRYRKITLRDPEKPLHVDKNESDSDDGESSEIDSFCHASSVVPGPCPSTSCEKKSEISVDTSYENGNETKEKTESVTKSDDESLILSSSSLILSQRFVHHPSSGTYPPQHSQANSYSRVTVIGTREDSVTELGSSSTHHLKSDHQPKARVLKKKPSLDEREEVLNNTTPFAGFQSQEETSSPSMFVESEFLMSPVLLPAPSGEIFTDFSQNSLDDILVEPPEMFGAGMEQVNMNPRKGFALDSPLKRKLSRTRNISGTNLNDSKSTDKIPSCLDFSTKKSVPNTNGHSIPDQKISGAIPDISVDRNSTESNDTGYTSSTSPGYQNQINSQQQQQQQKHPCGKDFNAGVSRDGRSTPIPEEELKNTGERGALKPCSSSHSLGSNSSDTSRFYVPFVFHSKDVVEDGVNMRMDPSKFCIQVCLAENSEELIRVRQAQYS